MSDITVVNDTGEVEKAPQPMVSEHLDGDYLGELEFKSIASVMGLERESELNLYKDKINTLLSYAKTQTDDPTPENLKWVIRSLELKLGTPPFAEKRINWVSRYAYLMTEEARILKEKEKFTRV